MLTSVNTTMVKADAPLTPLGQRIDWIVKNKGFGSDRKLSLAAGLAPGHVWQIRTGERGKRELTREVCAKIASAAGVSARWLATGRGSHDDGKPYDDDWAPAPPTPAFATHVPSSLRFPRREQAVSMLEKYYAKNRAPLAAAVIEGLKHEEPPDGVDLSLDDWLAKARDLEGTLRAHLEPTKKR